MVIAIFGEGALGAFGASGLADVAAMQNQPVVCVQKILRGYAFQELLFHLDRILSFCKPCDVADSEDVGINCHGGLSKGDVQYDIGSFAANTWEFFKLLARPGDLAMVLGGENLCRLHEVQGLGLVQTNRFNVSLQFDLT